MKNTRYKKGFTLVEVMLAAAIMAIGLMLVAGAFPVGIKLTAVSTERTIGAIAANEAFAKIHLFGDPNKPNQPPYGIDFSQVPVGGLIDFGNVLKQGFDTTEYEYPSADTGQTKYYHWSALLKSLGGTRTHAVVFVTRTAGAGARYPNPIDLTNTIPIPKPIPVPVVFPDTDDDNKIIVFDDGVVDFDDIELLEYISDGAILVMVDEITKDVMILNVLEVDRINNTLKLIEAIDSDLVGSHFWVIPTAVGSSRNPCIGVYQETMTF